MAHYWLPDATSNTGTGNWSATGATGHWADDAAGTNLGKAAPGTTDNVFFGASAFNGAGQVVTVDATASCKNMDWTGATNSPTLAGSQNFNFYDNVTFISAMVITYNGNFSPKGNVNLNMGGLATSALQINSGNPSNLTLLSNFVSTSSVRHTWGTISLNGYTMTVNDIRDEGNAGSQVLAFGTGGVLNCAAFNYTNAANPTSITGTGTINDSGIFSGQGKTYNIVNLTGATSTITGNNTINTLGFMRSGVQTITVTGVTQTITNFIRDAGNAVKTIVNGTFTKIIGGGINLDYLSISGSTATTTIYAGKHSTDGGGNSGWVFNSNPEVRISRLRRYLAAGMV